MKNFSQQTNSRVVVRAPFSCSGRRCIPPLCGMRMRGDYIVANAPHPRPLPERERGYSTGFTLIELMIAIGIFSVFIVIITGVFSRFVEVQRHSIAQGTLILDVQSAMESFVKEARTGYGSTYRTENGKQVTFRNQKGVCVSYRLGESIVAGVRRGVFERAEISGNTSGSCTGLAFAGVVFTPLTGNGTNISAAFFDTTPSVYNTATLVLENQGVVTLALTAVPLKTEIPPLVVQNTVTSRQVRAYGK